MHRASLRTKGRFLCGLASLGLLIALVPGCGDEPIKTDQSAGGIPTALKNSNDQMLKFMESKKAAKAEKKK
jgi:hypothetical protein